MIEMDIRRLDDMGFQVTEAINTLATNLSFVGGTIKKILITSCRPHEGKSFICMNLMRALAGLGMKVILVDADIRASTMQGSYGIDIDMPDGGRYRGLTGYLSGRCNIKDIIAQTNISGAHMILAGSTVTNSLPLFNTARFGTLLNELAQNYDIVLVDAPPVRTIIDAAKIATWCDGTVFVVQSGADTAAELREASSQIEKSGCPIAGYVLNKFDERKHGGGYYDRDNYYANYEGRKKGKGKSRSVKGSSGR